MIRKFKTEDIEDILSIWLESSVKAHDFIDASFWKSQIKNMRDIYIPASESYVYEHNSKVVGFYSLCESNLAAIFIMPKFQGRGFGKKLLTHAKSQRSQLSLNVYTENKASCRFYRSQGFHVINQQTDNQTGHPEYTMSTSP